MRLEFELQSSSNLSISPVEHPSPRATRECVLLRDRKVQKHIQPAQAQKWVQIPHKDEPKPQMRLEFELLAVQICRSPRWSTYKRCLPYGQVM